MRNWINYSGILSILVAIPFATGVARAQDSRPKAPERIRGSNIVDLRSKVKSNEDYDKNQEEAIQFFTNLAATAKGLAAGNSGKIAAPSNGMLNYLGAAYLYCSINEGICRTILDSLLEADIINSKQDKADTCPILTTFWKLYLENGLEDRHKYNTKTGYLSETVAFNQKERPKYVRCQSTVKSETGGSTSDSEYFKLRYRNRPELIKNIEQTVSILHLLKEKVPNLFGQLGALPNPNAPGGKPVQPARGPAPRR